jgi:4-amino-4-deoxy-L-arabinose transferase-like glycosyltransferase
VHPSIQAPRSIYTWSALFLLLSLAACLAVDFAYFPNKTVLPDETRFLESAQRLAATGQFMSGDGHAWEMPGTAIFQAPFFAAFGPHPLLAIRTAQAILLLIQAALSGWIAFQLFNNRRSAVVAVAVGALYPFFIFFQGLMLSEAPFNVLLVAAMAALLLWYKRGLRADWSLVLACAIFAAATYVKATLTILPPFLFAATLFVAGGGLIRALRIFVLASLLYAACLTPWWVRNYLVLGTFVPFTTSASQNLYLGNNPTNLHAGVDWATDADPDAVKRMMDLPDEVMRQRAFSTAAIAYIKEDPSAFLKRMALKFVRFWNVVPNAQDFRTPLFAVVSAVSFGPVLLLAIVCAAFSYAPQRLLVPLYLLFLYFTLVHVITIASLRYRLPLDPFLIVLAADPLRRLIDAGTKIFRQSSKQPAA